ncbi:MAG: hypothetical protein ACK4JA_11935, partial [Parazoarcus communis]
QGHASGETPDDGGNGGETPLPPDGGLLPPTTGGGGTGTGQGGFGGDSGFGMPGAGQAGEAGEDPDAAQGQPVVSLQPIGSTQFFSTGATPPSDADATLERVGDMLSGAGVDSQSLLDDMPPEAPFAQPDPTRAGSEAESDSESSDAASDAEQEEEEGGDAGVEAADAPTVGGNDLPASDEAGAEVAPAGEAGENRGNRRPPVQAPSDGDAGVQPADGASLPLNELGIASLAAVTARSRICWDRGVGSKQAPSADKRKDTADSLS